MRTVKPKGVREGASDPAGVGLALRKALRAYPECLLWGIGGTPRTPTQRGSPGGRRPDGPTASSWTSYSAGRWPVPPRQALPGKDTGITRPMDRALDTLTDPDTRGTSGVRVNRGAQGNAGNSVIQDVSYTTALANLRQLGAPLRERSLADSAPSPHKP